MEVFHSLCHEMATNLRTQQRTLRLLSEHTSSLFPFTHITHCFLVWCDFCWQRESLCDSAGKKATHRYCLIKAVAGFLSHGIIYVNNQWDCRYVVTTNRHWESFTCWLTVATSCWDELDALPVWGKRPCSGHVLALMSGAGFIVSALLVSARQTQVERYWKPSNKQQLSLRACTCEHYHIHRHDK